MPQGRARLLDGSTPRGPSSFWRRVPARGGDDTPGLFGFSDGPESPFPAALAYDLMLLPPCDAVALPAGAAIGCLSCHGRAGVPDASIAALGPRHFVQCPHGMRCPATVHDPLVRALTALLDAMFGADRVLAERTGSRRQIDEWCATHLTGHRPDIVVRGMHGPGSFTVVEVRTFDATGPTHVTSHATDRRRGGAHVSLASAATVQYGPMPPRSRLVPFVVSTTGAMGRQAAAFIAELAGRSPSSVPYALLQEASWAAPTFASFARCAVATAVRRAVGGYHIGYWGGL